MFRRRRSAKDFSDEVQAHLQLEADELEAEGLSREEAHRRARVVFGNVDAAQERFYLKGRVLWLDNLIRDLKFARACRKPGVRPCCDFRADARRRFGCGDLRFRRHCFAAAAPLRQSQSPHVC